MSLEMFTFRGVEVPAFPEALAAHVPAPRWIVGTGVTGSAQQGCQSAQARGRLAQSQGLTKADCCDGSPATAPFLLLLSGTMPAEEAFFLRLFPEQEFSWSRQGFLHFPAAIFRLAGAELFLWQGCPELCPAPVPPCSRGCVCSGGWQQVPGAPQEGIAQTSAVCPSSALQEV